MQTISDIRRDEDLFSEANDWIFILYQIDGVARVIPLSCIRALSFMKLLDDIQQCQNEINMHNDKTFTLFAYSGNIETWLWNNNPLPDNLNEIILFCPLANDKGYLKRWTKRFTQKIKRIYTIDELEREILTFGMSYIQDLLEYFDGNNDKIDSLREEHERMRLALMDCLNRAILTQDDHIQLGIASTS